MPLPAGMDHRHYAFSALPGRTAHRWPGGSRIAAYAVLFLEHWELQPPEGALRDPRLVGEFGSFYPDYRSWTQREYGLRIGIFRVIEALKDAGIEYDSADATFQPSMSVEVDLETARKVLKLIDALEDSDDVQDVFTNIDIPDDVAAQLDED